MILPLTKNIYAYAQHILSNPTDAADITQEVMIKLWNTRRELKGVQNPRAWALKVTRNLCLDWIKKPKQFPHPVKDTVILFTVQTIIIGFLYQKITIGQYTWAGL